MVVCGGGGLVGGGGWGVCCVGGDGLRGGVCGLCRWFVGCCGRFGFLVVVYRGRFVGVVVGVLLLGLFGLLCLGLGLVCLV